MHSVERDRVEHLEEGSASIPDCTLYHSRPSAAQAERQVVPARSAPAAWRRDRPRGRPEAAGQVSGHHPL